MADKLSAREACLDALIKFEKNKSYSNIELSSAIDRHNFNDLDRAFFTHLFYGVIERKLTLDFYINLLVANNKDMRIANILRMGFYQILYMEKVPDSAACNESVELAKKLKNKHAPGFVNAVMRNFLRRRKELEQQFAAENNLETKYSCNHDIIDIWKDSYGQEIAEKILESSINSPIGFAITVNTIKISRDAYAEKLTELGVRCEKISEYGVYVFDELPIKKLYGFDEGFFFVQDESSQICAFELSAKPDDLVLDVCAAPGGKSLFIAQSIKNQGKIIALDLHENKLRLIKKSAERLGINIIQTHEHDSTKPIPLNVLDRKADCIICDVPCSGLGVVAKKPEIKYKSLDNFAHLPTLQYKILSNCAEYLKPDGVLVYSTCTLNKKENEDIVYKFLEDNNKFKLENIKTFFPFDRTERKIDGFFLAKMRLDGV